MDAPPNSLVSVACFPFNGQLYLAPGPGPSSRSSAVQTHGKRLTNSSSSPPPPSSLPLDTSNGYGAFTSSSGFPLSWWWYRMSLRLALAGLRGSSWARTSSCMSLYLHCSTCEITYTILEAGAVLEVQHWRSRRSRTGMSPNFPVPS